MGFCHRVPLMVLVQEKTNRPDIEGGAWSDDMCLNYLYSELTRNMSPAPLPKCLKCDHQSEHASVMLKVPLSRWAQIFGEVSCRRCERAWSSRWWVRGAAAVPNP